jgi:hypothetical protein
MLIQQGLTCLHDAIRAQLMMQLLSRSCLIDEVAVMNRDLSFLDGGFGRAWI